MNQAFKPAYFIGFFIVILACLTSPFLVFQTEQALVLELGKLRRVIQSPGLYFKIPLIQNVVHYDKRILTIAIPPAEVTLGDQKRAVVDTFLRYRISDPIVFYKTLSDEISANRRLSDLVSGVLRSTLGTYELVDLLSKKRQDIMKKIQLRTNEAMNTLGIDVVDVRIRRTELPYQNNMAIFERIISERKKEAMEIRARGEEKRTIIRSEAHMEGDLLMAKALEEAGVIRGNALKKAQTVYREAYGQNSAFARFFQTLEEARKSFSSGQTSYILGEEHPFLSTFNPPCLK